ncbi:glycoside hydrolase family 18 protein [Janthinobacterium sp. FW305-129]|uniref:glycosyl hydrolase family 18 protein n=1 Tax=Janthinobacterium sp. FW305-129 TaxID=2775054 RepID=UPI001E3A4580|nr:glycosyl hydrolase family 18 protein [Janthinobacterium sp. FW305-129]MCC7596099.1 glycoside hydrolase family 18 protein [Janthinobacterium sp. FW305-129]
MKKSTAEVGLKWQFHKRNGVDTIVLLNASQQELYISSLEITLNIAIGTLVGGNSLDAIMAAKKIEEKDWPAKKQEFFLEEMNKHEGPLDKRAIAATDVFFAPWGALASSEEHPAEYSRAVSYKGGDYVAVVSVGTEAAGRMDPGGMPEYVYQVRYLRKPAVIPANLGRDLSYVSSFKYLVCRSSIDGLTRLPSIRVQLDGSSDWLEVPLDLLQASMGDKRSRVIDQSCRGLVSAAAFSRRSLGYYANYFGYQRDVFIRDVPFQNINELSYGMFTINLDGTPASSDPWGDDWQLSSLQFMKQLNPDLKVHLIVGGWPKVVEFDVGDCVTLREMQESAARDVPLNDGVTISLYRVKEGEDGSEMYYRLWQPLTVNGSVLQPSATATRFAWGKGFLTQYLSGYWGNVALVLGSAIVGNGRRQDYPAEYSVRIQLALAAALQQKIQPSAELFSMVGTDPAKARRFAEAMVQSVVLLGFDGIEIDWEYPGKEDGAAYVRILEALRAAEANPGLNPERRKIYLGIASPAAAAKIRLIDSGTLPSGTDTYWRPIGRLVDTIHMMTYDYGGPWLKYSDFNAPMLPASEAGAGEQPSGVRETLTTMLGYADRLCFTRQQLSLGLPIYGRGVKVVPEAGGQRDPGARLGINCRTDGPAEGQFADQPGTYLYSHIASQMKLGSRSDKFPNYVAPGLHPKARAPYLYVPARDGQPAISVTYDDPASIREKIRYAKTESLGGVMAWDLSGDLPASDPRSLLRAIGDELRQERPPAQPELRELPDFSLYRRAAKEGTALPARPLWNVGRDYGASLESRDMAVSAGVLAMAALPGGRLALALADGAVQIMAPNRAVAPWEWETRSAWHLAAPAVSLLALPSGRLLVLQQNGDLARIDVQDSKTPVLRLAAGLAPRAGSLLAGWGEQALLFDGTVLRTVAVTAAPGQEWQVSPPMPLAANALVALPGGLLLSGGTRSDEMPSVAVWKIEGGKLALQAAVPRSKPEDWGAIAFLSVLSDGAVAALTAYGNYQAYGPAALQPERPQPAAWSALSDGEQVGRALLPLPQGGFLSISDGAYMFWGRRGDGYVMLQRLSGSRSADAAAVLDNGDVVIARGAELRYLAARSWPRAQACLQPSWNWRDGDDGRSWLHHLAAAGNQAGMAQALAEGAPPDLQATDAASGAQESVAETALRAQRCAIVPQLTAAGAPLWSGGNAERTSALLNEPVLAALLPPELLASTPYLLPDLPLAGAPIAAATAAFLSDNPRLATLIATALAPVLPETARQVQHLVQDYAIDAALLAAARGEGDTCLMHVLVPDGARADDCKQAEGVGEDLRQVLAQLLGQRHADPDAFIAAIDAVWTAPDKARPWRRQECRQLVAAAARPKRPDAYRLVSEPAVCDLALLHYAALVELGWPAPAGAPQEPLSRRAPAHYRMLMQAGRDALTPNGWDDPVLRPGLAVQGLPNEVTALLDMAPWMAAPMGAAADALVSGMGVVVRDYHQQELDARRLVASDLAAVQDPYTALGEFSGGAAMAGLAMQQLLLWSCTTPQGAALALPAAAALLALRAPAPWIPQGDVNAYAQQWFSWAEDPPYLAQDPTALPEQTDAVTPLPARSSNAPVRRVLASAGAAAVPPAPDVDEEASRRRRLEQSVRATQMKFMVQTWQNNMLVDSKLQAQEDERLLKSPYTARIDELTRNAAQADATLSNTRARRELVRDLENKPFGMSAAELRKAGIDVKLPAGMRDDQLLPDDLYDDALEHEHARLDGVEKDALAARSKAIGEVDGLRRKRDMDPQRLRQLEQQAKLKGQLEAAQRKLSKMQDYALLADSIAHYGASALDWLHDKGVISGKFAEVAKTILTWANRIVQIGIAVATIAYGWKQMRAMQGLGSIGKGGGISMMFSIGMAAFNIVQCAIFGPPPDPMEEMYKALSKQIEEVGKALQESLAAMSQQLASMQAGIYNRLDGIEDKIDGLGRELGRQMAELSAQMDEGFAAGRAETRQATAQVLLAMQRGFDSVERRFDLIEDRLGSDLHYLQEMMTVSLMDDYATMDIAIANAETESLHGATAAAADGPRLADDPARLADYRNRLVNGVRNKLLGLPRRKLEDTLDSSWLQTWPLPAGVASRQAGQVSINRIGDCHDFYVRRSTGAEEASQRVYFSAAYGKTLASRLLWVSEHLMQFSDHPQGMIADLDELIVAPSETLQGFLSDFADNQPFLDGLLDDYVQALASLAARCRAIIPVQGSQDWRLPPGRLGDAALLHGLMFDAVPVLDLAELEVDSVAATQLAERASHLGSMSRFLTSPSLGWRAVKLQRVLAVAHALRVADLSLASDEGQVTLWVAFRGARQPVAQLRLVAGQVVDSQLLIIGNSLLVQIQRAVQPVQQRWIAQYNGRIAADAKAELAALDGSVARLIQFMALAGLAETAMSETLSLIWTSGRLGAYLASQTSLASSAQGNQFSPPVAAMLQAGQASAETARARLRATLAARAGREADDVGRDPLVDRLRQETHALLERALAHRAMLQRSVLPPLLGALDPEPAPRLQGEGALT